MSCGSEQHTTKYIELGLGMDTNTHDLPYDTITRTLHQGLYTKNTRLWGEVGHTTLIVTLRTKPGNVPGVGTGVEKEERRY